MFLEDSIGKHTGISQTLNLHDMSVHETPRSLKRDHDAFTDRPDVQQILPNPTNFLEQLKKEEDKSDANKISASSEIIQPSQPQREPSPARSTTESLLSDVGPFTPSDVANSPMISAVATTTSNTASPSAFAALNGNPPPPSKKVKMTFAEKEEKRILKEIKEAERAADKAKKEAEKMADKVQKEAEKAAEKAQKEAEKEADRRKKEVEREEKRAAQEAEKAAKEEKRRKKEEEKQKVEEEKKKKERSQKKLNSFFSIPSTAAKGRRGSVDSKEHPKLKSIDPFSTFYWAPNPPLQTTTMDPPRIPLTTIKPNASTLPCPPKPFFAPASSTPSSSLPQTSKLPPGRPKLPKLLPADDIPKFRQAVQGSNLSKVGLIEVLKKQFPGRQAAAIKGTLEVVARRVGVKEKDKRWVVVGDVE
ncbi:putative Stress response protein nst1 [Glarea lozoyensis 74030]|uniref:Putative Stress response protein nst1 n=1 Tax=Glarea lozoyensis (strain ATCC 74030 / MF5533) TaxID=1104152 RepID=H0EU71_GLAL7|nr:putative Stress response protein nst1 [Glarea lozoyensis 74030]